MSHTFPILPTDKWYVCYGPSTVVYVEVPAGCVGATGQPNEEAYDTEEEALLRAIELGYIPPGEISADVLSVYAPSAQIKWASTDDIFFLNLLPGARIVFSNPPEAISEGAVCLSKDAQTGITVWDTEVTLKGDGIPFTITYKNALKPGESIKV